MRIFKVWKHIKKALNDLWAEPPEIIEVKEHAHQARVVLLMESMNQQRKAHELRQELASTALARIVRG